MATVTNKSINTGSVTNKSQNNQQMWASSTVSWASGGKWASPFSTDNRATNTASVTNKALS